MVPSPKAADKGTVPSSAGKTDDDRKSVLVSCGILPSPAPTPTTGSNGTDSDNEKKESAPAAGHQEIKGSIGKREGKDHEEADMDSSDDVAADNASSYEEEHSPSIVSPCGSAAPLSLQRGNARAFVGSAPGAFAYPGPDSTDYYSGPTRVHAATPTLGESSASVPASSQSQHHPEMNCNLNIISIEQHSSSVTSNLNVAVANLVSEEEENNDEEIARARAQEIDLQRLQKSQMERRKEGRVFLCNRIGVGLLILGIVVCVATMAVLLPRGSRDDSDAKEEKATANPTEQLFLSEENRLLSLLPDDTVHLIKDIPGSAQSKAFQWSLQDPNVTVYSAERFRQRYALATLYYSTNGDNWNSNHHWLSYDHHECDWFAFYTHGFYDYPEIFWNYLYINVTGNEAPCDRHTNYGEDDYNNATYRHLWLISNALQGTLPPELFLLTSLKSISLDRNKLEGAIPSQIGNLQDLEALGLFNNELTSTLPTEIGLLTSTRFLWLMNNQINGGIPSEIGQLSESLQYLLMDGNRLSSTIPSEVGLLRHVRWFWLNSNDMHGTLPTELGNMESLGSFALDNRNQFSGTIPTELGRASNLWKIHAGHNLSGPIPSEIGLLSNMFSIWLPTNALTGSLPTELGKLTLLETLSAFDNQFLTGTLPSELYSLKYLKNVRLYNNSLSGSISPKIGLLQNIEHLDLSLNYLTGTLPISLGGMDDSVSYTNRPYWDLDEDRAWYWVRDDKTNNSPQSFLNLTYLSLHDNSLTGPLPSSLDQLTSLAVLAIYNNFLTGNIPDIFCDEPTMWQETSTPDPVEGLLQVDCDLVSCTCSVCTCG